MGGMGCFTLPRSLAYGRHWLPEAGSAGNVLGTVTRDPPHDTFGRVFARLNPEQIEVCFTRWLQSLAAVLRDQVVPVDGNTARRSHNAPRGVPSEMLMLDGGVAPLLQNQQTGHGGRIVIGGDEVTSAAKGRTCGAPGIFVGLLHCQYGTVYGASGFCRARMQNLAWTVP